MWREKKITRRFRQGRKGTRQISLSLSYFMDLLDMLMHNQNHMNRFLWARCMQIFKFIFLNRIEQLKIGNRGEKREQTGNAFCVPQPYDWGDHAERSDLIVLLTFKLIRAHSLLTNSMRYSITKKRMVRQLRCTNTMDSNFSCELIELTIFAKFSVTSNVDFYRKEISV